MRALDKRGWTLGSRTQTWAACLLAVSPTAHSLLCDNPVSLGEQRQAKALDGCRGIQGGAHGAKVWGGRAPGEAGLDTACYRLPPLQGTGKRAGVKLCGQEDGVGRELPASYAISIITANVY